MKFYLVRTVSIALFLLCLAAALVLPGAPAAGAGLDAGKSVNVVIIGGSTLDRTCSAYGPTVANMMSFTGGGCLPLEGLSGELGDFTFAPLLPSAVSATTLAPFDTAVLNMASSAMACNADALTTAQKQDLVAFAAGGKKLVIYDSECQLKVNGQPRPVDYSWLPFPFTTANPGALGEHGTLTIPENSTLASNDPASPYYIDATNLSQATDAVGDMNVMTTFDANWCVSMSGTNAINVTGPVHTYAKIPTGTDQGLLIYNGLDQDFLFDYPRNAYLRKIWVQELQQPVNPSLLPCGITVVGITLNPPTATHEAGENHTVTATLVDLLAKPQAGIPVTFSVIAGPNAGASGACSPNANCATNAAGQVNFTYKGAGGKGVDEIKACFTNGAGQVVCSLTVTAEWVVTNKPPVCSAAGPSIGVIWPPNHEFVAVQVTGVADPDGDPVTLKITGIRQDEPVDANGDGSFAPDGRGVGTAKAEVRAERNGTPKLPGDGRVYHIAFTATDDRGTSCDGEVKVAVPHDQKHPAVDGGALYDSTVP